MSTFCLVYTSLAKDDLHPTELDAILTTSRRNNHELGITGLLLHHEGRFLQILEGGAESVQLLYHHIETDPRHLNTQVTFCNTIPQRNFSHWGMDYIPFNCLDKKQQRGFFDLQDLRLVQDLPEMKPMDKIIASINLFAAAVAC